ncbi:hypothetical protein [Pseudonocardia kunmingensis]|uniref:PASTA domain-containing protein n=1 Tax=Pseudonocardia kunmingensis TaxID=630975 RepID=A0A543DR65_9PSEU|nr:hypothetical protein [Pseudonocardia kunmingensis]TQM11794.1 hypothetical protein FB558_4366 [Pseudonocardia kunmingensis]
MNLTTRRGLRLAATLGVAAALTGCGSGAGAPAAPAGPSVPDVVDDPLDRAVSTLQAVRFPARSQDLLGDRSQAVDGTWIVCTQDPEPGPAAEGTVVELGVVKDVEACPGAVAVATPPATTTPVPTSAAVAEPQRAPRPAPEPAEEDDSGGAPPGPGRQGP